MKKFNCKKCKDKVCLKSGKPCNKVEKMLKDNGVFSRDYIRPQMSSSKRDRGRHREVPFSSIGMDSNGNFGHEK